MKAAPKTKNPPQWTPTPDEPSGLITDAQLRGLLGSAARLTDALSRIIARRAEWRRHVAETSARALAEDRAERAAEAKNRVRAGRTVRS